MTCFELVIYVGDYLEAVNTQKEIKLDTYNITKVIIKVKHNERLSETNKNLL